ncbi:PHP domain-containing protein [Rhodovulum sp. ES.010]|uniref:PHP domain-containing protein n=1 Tax=Rhodovulum sp. ES.010 TaxID=1882821 RepID=UPI001C376206|nr:PHP domain-containing protein [Rhodovulum sp. ES.010]
MFDGETRVAGATEEEVYAAIGLPRIDPVLRENRGEIEAAEAGDLPDLVTLDAMRGDLHAHTTGSDGKNTLREMAEAARARGYDYLAITDHSKSRPRREGSLPARSRRRSMRSTRSSTSSTLSSLRCMRGSTSTQRPRPRGSCGRSTIPESALSATPPAG